MVLESTCRCTNDYYCFICSWAGKFSVVVGVVLKSWDTYCVELNNLRNENERQQAIWPDCSYALAPKDS
jgi:hypothetical protein